VTVRRASLLAIGAAVMAACATAPLEETIEDLNEVEADLETPPVEESVDDAEQSYRRYLETAPEGAETAEAMRRMADLQIEKVYGVVGTDPGAAMPTPRQAAPAAPARPERKFVQPRAPAESDSEFERRTTRQDEELLRLSERSDETIAIDGQPVPTGPLEAIETYKKILADYRNYARKDEVLYQLARAYDEIGQPEEAIKVMERLVADYPYTRTADEVNFRRGEFYFVRKRWRSAEQAYRALVAAGPDSPFYEHGLYKLGWSLYKQAFYEEALDNFVAVLDHRKMNGYVFEQYKEEGEAHRVTDTFRVISLSVDNLGGPEVLEEYFDERGQRTYADNIYANLAEYYFEKRRFDDAATVYRAFVELNPMHRKAPTFSRRAIEIFEQAGFPQRVVEAKKEFSTRFALASDYWIENEIYESPGVIDFIRDNLVDLSSYYHALYQDPRYARDRSGNFDEARRWYREIVRSYPASPATPMARYRLADLLLEQEEYVDAAIEYDHAAYDYTTEDWSDDAAYAAIYSYRKELESADGARRRGVMNLAATSSLQFADTFPGHEQVPNVLTNAANDLYELRKYPLAIDAARKMIARYPHSHSGLRRSAWSVVAYSSIEVEDYVGAERAFNQVLALTPSGSSKRAALVDGLAAAVFKQGEVANRREDYEAAVEHFRRVEETGASSNLRISAEYGAAVALIGMQEWAQAAADLETFRKAHSGHRLAGDATRQLAYVYNEIGEITRSAAEREKLAAAAEDPSVARDELLTAGDLYNQTGALAEAARVYEEYVGKYPEPVDINMDTRLRVAEIHKELGNDTKYYEQLEAMVTVANEAGEGENDRIRLLAANAALDLAERSYDEFARLKLTQPFDRSLPQKQDGMDRAIAALEGIVNYEVAEVTAAATYYIAQTYMNFSASLLESERPAGMSQTELNSYELLIEEEAYPFEDQAIAVHEANYEFMLTGVYNEWIQKSLDELAALLPARYAKQETSEGLLRSVDTYIYRAAGATEAPALTIVETAPISDEYREAFGKSLALLDQGERQASIESLTFLTSESPMVAASHINLGIAQHQAGNLDSAEEHLQNALALGVAARHPAALTELGIVYRKLGRFALAKDSYEAALSAAPEYHFARRNLGILCDLYLADTDCAMREYETYRTARPDDEEVAIWIADVSNRMAR
jgi:tetratricopeptide (TPR) repeat protein